MLLANQRTLNLTVAFRGREARNRGWRTGAPSLKLDRDATAKQAAYHKHVPLLFNTLASAPVRDDDSSGRTLLRVILLPFLLRNLHRRPADVWDKRLSLYVDMQTPLDTEIFRFSAKPIAYVRNDSSPSERAFTHLRDGKVGKAARALFRNSVPMTIDESTFDKLEQLHPQRQGLTPGAPPNKDDAVAYVEVGNIIDAIVATDNSTGNGAFGWGIDYITILMGPVVDARANPPPVVKGLHTIAQWMCKGKWDLVAPLLASRLVALKKPDSDKPRPLALSDLLIRIPCKAYASKYSRTADVLPNQFGVGKKGGVECIVHVLRGLMEEAHTKGTTLHVTGIDCKNAFNSLSRETIHKAIRTHNKHLLPVYMAAYQHSSTVVCDGTHIDAQGDCSRIARVLMSSSGVRQGDPLGPLLFTLGLRERGKWLDAMCGPSGTWLAYLDDIYIIHPDALVGQRIVAHWNDAHFRNVPPEDGLVLNTTKCVLTDTGRMHASGLKVLGSIVGGPNVEADFACDKLKVIRDHLHEVMSLAFKHDAFCILRETWLPLVAHHLRCLPKHLWTDPNFAAKAAIEELERAQEDFMDVIRSNTRPDRKPMTALFERLPVRMGGIGLPSAVDTASHAYDASVCLTAHALEDIDILPPDYKNIFRSALNDPDATLSQRVRVTRYVYQPMHLRIENFHAINAAQDQHEQRIKCMEREDQVARAWLETGAPGFKRGAEALSNFDFAAAMRKKTVVTPASEDTCDNCGCALAAMANNHHQQCLKRVQITRHNGTRDAIAKIIDEEHFEKGVEVCKLEPYVGTITKRNSEGELVHTQKRADLYISVGGIAGIGTQTLDFSIGNTSGKTYVQKNRPLRKTKKVNGVDVPDESVRDWTLRQLQSTVGAFDKDKCKQYKPLEPHNVTMIVMSTEGATSPTTRAWLREFPLHIRQAIRRAMCYSLLRFSNRSMAAHIRPNWNR